MSRPRPNSIIVQVIGFERRRVLQGGNAGCGDVDPIVLALATAAEAQSVTACTLTPIWQFLRLPSAPQYIRATPGEVVPSLGKPVVDDQGVGVDEPRRSPPGQPSPDIGVIPGRGRHELLQLLMIDPQPGRHRLHRVAVGEQPAQVELAPWLAGRGGRTRRTSPRRTPRSPDGQPRSLHPTPLQQNTSLPHLTKRY